MKRDQILRLATKAVGERNVRYGEPEDCFERISQLWLAWLRIRRNEDLGSVDVAVMMLLMKIARLANDPKHLDTWIDICGYGACGGELATVMEEQGK